MQKLRWNGSGVLLTTAAVLALGWTVGACSRADKTKPKSEETTSKPAAAPDMAPAPAPLPAKAGMAGQPAASPQKAGNGVDKCGTYKVDVKLPPRYPCKADADCGWTRNRPGSCLGPVCSHHYAAGTLAWVTAANKLHERVCTGQKYGYCNRYKCRHHRPTGAVCKNGKCALEPR